MKLGDLSPGDAVAGGFYSGRIPVRAGSRFNQIVKLDGLPPRWKTRFEKRGEVLVLEGLAPEEPQRINFNLVVNNGFYETVYRTYTINVRKVVENLGEA